MLSADIESCFKIHDKKIIRFNEPDIIRKPTCVKRKYTKQTFEFAIIVFIHLKLIYLKNLHEMQIF